MNSVNPLLIPMRVFESCLSHVTTSMQHSNSILDNPWSWSILVLLFFSPKKQPTATSCLKTLM